jgi:uncharacterized protein (TIGR03435 family)
MRRTNTGVQTLLADRFQLKLHRETKELPVYGLVVGKNGSKLSTEAFPRATAPRPAADLPDRGSTMCNPTTPMARLTLSYPSKNRPPDFG